MGIISDETKTKVGKDFMIYITIFIMIIKSMQKIVTLNEEFTFARNKNNCKIEMR
jgi:hypothetical protein